MMTDEELDNALNTALRAGRDSAKAADRVFTITARDRDVEVQIPVALVDGHAHLLGDEYDRARAIARSVRIDSADGPDQRTGRARHQSLASLVAHTKRFADGDSVIWADEDGMKISSILDYHKAGAGGATRWGRHGGEYPCAMSAAWQAWGAGKALKLSQDELAAHLDRRDFDLVGGTLGNGKPAPEPATLITIAASLEAYSNTKAKRERDSNTGRVTLSFSSDSGFVGNIAPPASFLISIPLFVDTDRQTVEVRLRAEVKDAGPIFTVQIHAADDLKRDAFRSLVGYVAKATGLPVFIGVSEYGR